MQVFDKSNKVQEWVEKKLALIANERERALRERLLMLVLESRIDEWQVARLVFADWLGDHDCLREEAAARAEWDMVRSIKIPGKETDRPCWQWTFLVRIENTEKRVPYKRHNSNWLLGFPPGSLALLNRAEDNVVFETSTQMQSHLCRYPLIPSLVKLTFVRKRDRENGLYEDGRDVTSKYPHGFLGMWWLPQKVETEDMGKTLFDEVAP